MKLIDEEELEKTRNGNKKTKKIIISLIFLLIILGIAICVLIFYKMYNPSKITTYIDGKIVQNFEKILDFETDENGNTKIYVPIREVASYFGYGSYNGEYNQASEESDKCYVIKDKCEVAMFSLKSKTIYKVNLQKNNDEFDYCYVDINVFENNGILYTSVDGIEKGYNVSFNYDENKKEIKIYTMDQIIATYQAKLKGKTIGEYGEVEIDSGNYQNYKSIFDEDGMMLIVKTKNNKYGVINVESDISKSTFILEPKYDSIEYIQYSSDFLVQNNRKYGILSKDGKAKVSVAYDELVLMDRDAGLYRIKQDRYYGVIDENENVIINPENNQIGINVSSFKRNGVKSGYILLKELIPVKKEKLWGFYNTKGELITEDFIYEDIGCKLSNSNNIYSLLEVTGYDVIVVKSKVGSKDKYTFMDVNGNDQIVPTVLDEIYIKILNGETLYEMKKNDKTYEVLKYLEKANNT